MLVRMTSPVWMEGCVSALAGLSAVIFIPDDTPKTGVAGVSAAVLVLTAICGVTVMVTRRKNNA